MQLRAIFAAVFVSSLAGCALQMPVAHPGLEGTHWQLMSVSGHALNIPDSPPIELRFQDSRVNFHGCNALSGRYSQEGNQIVVPKEFVSTKMMCHADVMQIDKAASELFHKGAKVTLYSRTLVLESDRERWSFKRFDPPALQSRVAQSDS